MSNRMLGFVAVSLIACGTLYSTFAQQPATKTTQAGAVPNVVPEKIPNAIEEPKPIPADNHIGRYQVTGLNSSNSYVLVDTHTGQCWIKSPTQQWQDQGTPVK